MTTTLNEIPRDVWGRPKVVPPGGGRAVPYTRCTTYVGCLDDMYNIQQWEKRMVAKGLSMRPDLLLAVSATDLEDKDKLNQLTTQAKEAAESSAKATIGTAIHALTERIDRGQDVGVIPEAYKPDLAAYERATAPLTAVVIETFCVVDDLKIGGTPDRVVEYQGRHYIADVKTGGITYGIGKIAMQLAVYSRGVQYNHLTETRTPLPDVDQDRGIIIHLPAGTGTCELVWVDIATGWKGVALAGKVREWRSAQKLTTPWAEAQPFPEPLTLAPDPTPAPTRDLDNLIASAPTVDALTALWVEHQQVWTPGNTELAAARKALLLGQAAA